MKDSSSDPTKEAPTMRKLIVASIVSLDGYVAGPGGNVMVLPMDAFFDVHNLERLRAADTLLLGATTYVGLKSYWPLVAQDPTVSPAVQRDASVADLHRETGQRNDAIAKVVVSDSLTEADTAPWTDTTTIVRRAGAHEAVRALKEQDGGDILMFGSRTLWNDLLAAELVDELHLMLGGVVGDGVPAFDSTPRLRLLEVEQREGSDNVLHRYEVVR
jgi:dihydrofolate reductase